MRITKEYLCEHPNVYGENAKSFITQYMGNEFVMLQSALGVGDMKELQLVNDYLKDCKAQKIDSTVDKLYYTRGSYDVVNYVVVKADDEVVVLSKSDFGLTAYISSNLEDKLF